jgi:hypothetical protein
MPQRYSTAERGSGARYSARRQSMQNSSRNEYDNLSANSDYLLFLSQRQINTKRGVGIPIPIRIRLYSLTERAIPNDATIPIYRGDRYFKQILTGMMMYLHMYFDLSENLVRDYLSILIRAQKILEDNSVADNYLVDMIEQYALIIKQYERNPLNAVIPIALTDNQGYPLPSKEIYPAI